MNLRFRIQYLAGGDATSVLTSVGRPSNTVTRSGLSAECPNLGRLLRNLRFSLRGESEIMAAILDQHEQPTWRRGRWLGSHQESVGAWLTGVVRF